MFKILAVGIATVDIINTVKHYPGDDDEVRALEQMVQRGGNATNTLVVLSQLGCKCSWAGIIADDTYAVVIRKDLSKHSIAMDYVVESNNAVSPVSCITLSKDTGRRSIVHYRDLPEFSFADFSRVNLSRFDWLHFEGRNVEQTILMLHAVRALPDPMPVSIEIEKPRKNIELLFGCADVLLFSRVFARHSGFDDAPAFLQYMHARYPEVEHYCAWGEYGAFAIDHQGALYHAAAASDIEIVDTVGAGDVFNAGVINAKITGLSLQRGLNIACELASNKCSQYGFAALVGE